MIKSDYLYIKEIGVDIRIKGVMNFYSVMLTDCFETEEDASNFLREHGWIYDKQTKKWYHPENAKHTLENEAGTVTSASRTICNPNPKHGKWIKDGEAYALYKCSACNYFCTVAGYANCIPEEQMYKTFKFCPNCGAKMERSEE